MVDGETKDLVRAVFDAGQTGAEAVARKAGAHVLRVQAAALRSQSVTLVAQSQALLVEADALERGAPFEGTVPELRAEWSAGPDLSDNDPVADELAEEHGVVELLGVGPSDVSAEMLEFLQRFDDRVTNPREIFRAAIAEAHHARREMNEDTARLIAGRVAEMKQQADGKVGA